MVETGSKAARPCAQPDALAVPSFRPTLASVAGGLCGASP